MRAHPDLTQSNLWQIAVPEDCVGKTFQHLFFHLLDQKLVVMALYRLKGSTDNDYPYVYTNPDTATIITHRDCAFVLGIEVPIEFQGDIYQMLDKEGALQLTFEGKTAQGSVERQDDRSKIVDVGKNQNLTQIEKEDEPILGIKGARYQQTTV